MGKEIAGDPQHLDSSLALQLVSKVCYFIQIPVGLLQGGALRSHIPAGNRGRTMFGRVEYRKTSNSLDFITFKYYHMYLFWQATQERWIKEGFKITVLGILFQHNTTTRYIT